MAMERMDDVIVRYLIWSLSLSTSLSLSVPGSRRMARCHALLLTRLAI
jgi:hypothetical protein